MEVERFCRSRPRLYHLTSAANRLRIEREGVIVPAAQVLERAGLRDWVTRRRREGLPVRLEDGDIDLRDQAPLHRGNIRLEGGWAFEDLIASLNAHVFFWPGTAVRPIAYGGRHFGRYYGQNCEVVIARTEAVLEANEGLSPRFCRYNSGSPRCSGGQGSPRGPGTFVPGPQFDGPPSSVVEVVFAGPVTLPDDAEWVAADDLAIRPALPPRNTTPANPPPTHPTP